MAREHLGSGGQAGAASCFSAPGALGSCLSNRPRLCAPEPLYSWVRAGLFG